MTNKLMNRHSAGHPRTRSAFAGRNSVAVRWETEGHRIDTPSDSVQIQGLLLEVHTEGSSCSHTAWDRNFVPVYNNWDFDTVHNSQNGQMSRGNSEWRDQKQRAAAASALSDRYEFELLVH